MKDDKIITRLLSIISILLIVLILLFFLWIYKDYKNIQNVSGDIGTTEIVGTVAPVLVPEENEEDEENEQFMVEPTIREENKEEPITIDNKFYYYQLDNYSKLIYKSLEEQKEKLKTGNSAIELPNKLSEIIENNNAQTIFSIAVNAFEYDNPDIFYIDSSKITLYYEKDNRGNYKIYLKNDKQYSNYFIDSFESKEQIEENKKEIDEIVDEILEKTQAMDKKNKIKYIHDWLVANIKYDETLNKTNRSNIYGALVEREVTCAGYAKSFKYIADKLNIDCIIIQGEATSDTGTENHAWNYVALDNRWYGLDCTWDDPIIIGGNENNENQVYYTYYLKGYNTFNNSHKPFNTFYSSNIRINYPELEQNDCN